MIIVIDSVCKKCNRNDPKDNNVVDWSKVKILLNVVKDWKCPFCGNKSAFWYFYRNIDKEVATSIEKEASLKFSYWQLFAETDENGKLITKIDIKVYDPVIRVIL